MNKLATSTGPTASASTLSEAELYCRDKLREMTDIGGMFLRMLFSDAAAMRKALKDEPDSATFPLPDQSDAYDTYCRAMRRNMMLDLSLDEPAAKPAFPPLRLARPQPVEPHEDAEPIEQTEASERSERSEWPEQLERPEQLDRPDTLEDDSGRPTAEIIAEVRRDLGITVNTSGAPAPPAAPGGNAGYQRPAAAVQSLERPLGIAPRDRFGRGPPAPNIRR